MEQLRGAMRQRLRFLAGLDETSRWAFMGAMLQGLMALPGAKRARMVETQMALITGELDPDAARTVSDSMSTSMTGTPPPEKFPCGMALFLSVPQVPMREFRRATETSYPLTLQESGFSDRWVAALGYLWHFNIGATFGITYTLLFGRGSWPLAFGWGAFVWLGMMALMPVMMPMIAFPWWFVIVPLVAHMAMAVPIGWVPRRFVDGAADGKSFRGLLREERKAPPPVGTASKK